MSDTMMGEQERRDEEAKGSPMWKFLDDEYDYKRPKRGDIRYAEVLRVDEDEIIVDIGGKTEGVVPSADLERMGEDAISEIGVGDKVPVYVLRPESADGDVIVSLNMARTMEDWRRAEELFDAGDVFEGTVAGYNKGGLLVYFGQIRGFIPASQLSGLSRRSSHEERMQTLSKMEGEEIMLKVIEVDRQRRRLIFSERAASREWREKRKSELLDELQEGDIRGGTVRNLCDFGAFVDLGGADGLIHISELSWRRVRHARDVLKVGDEVEVYVLRVDRQRKRIGLSLKRLQPDPWQAVEEKYEIGQVVKGKITNIVDFGAFARVEDGIEGLIHVSELSDGDFAPQDLVREGEELYLKILSIDSDRQRMGLSLKQAPTREEVEGEEAWASLREEPEAEIEMEEPGAELPVAVEVEEAGEAEPTMAAVEELEAEPEGLEVPLGEIEEPELEAEAEPTAALAGLEEVQAEAALEPEDLEQPVSEVAELEAEEEMETTEALAELDESEAEVEPEEPMAEAVEEEIEAPEAAIEPEAEAEMGPTEALTELEGLETEVESEGPVSAVEAEAMEMEVEGREAEAKTEELQEPVEEVEEPEEEARVEPEEAAPEPEEPEELAAELEAEVDQEEESAAEAQAEGSSSAEEKEEEAETEEGEADSEQQDDEEED
jgi:small subunit ribosomal protein S1